MTLTLVPHLRHQWTVVATKPGQLHLRCAKCRKKADLERLGRRVQRVEKMVAHPAHDGG